MKKIIIIILSLITLSVQAQEMKVSIKGDSTFNAADVEAKTIKGFDVDTSKINVINMAMQIACDVSVFNANDKAIEDAFPINGYHRQRADWILSSALPEHTNMYSAVTFLNVDGPSAAAAMVVVSNFEIEHFFTKRRMKLRIGRLSNTVSESQYFGRVALGESSAHLQGNFIYVNDAIEWDGRFKNGTGVYFVGMQPYFKPLKFKGFYAGMHQPFKNGMQMHTILSVNNTLEKDLQSTFPYYSKGNNVYYAYEAEIAHKTRATSVFLNAGGYVNYVGLVPHSSGMFDIMKQSRAFVYYNNKEDALKETFLVSTGVRVFPFRINPRCFVRRVGLEVEGQGLLSDRFTTVNVCAYCVISLTKRIIFSYYCTPTFLWQDINPTRKHYMSGVVNFFRVNCTVGKPGRTFM